MKGLLGLIFFFFFSSGLNHKKINKLDLYLSWLSQKKKKQTNKQTNKKRTLQREKSIKFTTKDT